jgi:ribosomal-protein-alanine N-acetyltransferase
LTQAAGRAYTAESSVGVKAMIYDRMDRLRLYSGLNANLDTLSDMLPQMNLSKREQGRHALAGSASVLDIQAGPLVGEDWLTHPGTIALRIVLEGEVTIEWVPADGVPGESVNSIVLKPGMFALFFPQDTHHALAGTRPCRRAVFEIAAEEPSPGPQPESALRHHGCQVLTTERLMLRPFRIQDAETMFHNWAGDPEVTKTLEWETHQSVEDTEAVLGRWATAYGSGRSYHWGIEMAGELIGDISAVRWSEKNLECEIGYCLSHKAWNRGIMTESLRSVMMYLFIEIGFRRITLRYDAMNPASGRVMQKAGLRQEGCQREAMLRKDGSYGDILLYAALREEWLPLHKTGE